MWILVIGGTRFVGRYIVEELLRCGHTITLYHRGRTEVAFSGPIHHIHGDRREHSTFKRVLANLEVDAVIDVVPMNERDVRALVEATQGRIHRSVFISSGDVYALGLPLPIPENAPRQPAQHVNWFLDGETVLYSKVAMEDEVFRAVREWGYPATVLRLPAIYGPHDPLAREWYFVKRVLDGRKEIALPAPGQILFHRGYVEDVAWAAVTALEQPVAVGKVYNIGHERVWTTWALAEAVARVRAHQWKIIEVPAKHLPMGNPYAPPYHILYDLSRIRADLGYHDSVSLEEGLARTVDWLCRNQPTADNWGLRHYMPHDAFDYAAEDEAICLSTQMAL